ncbi:MAG TPA: VacJ family lipoprotein [Rhodospirillales bacterium]|nr:VacJ family lipoprotein [Rhodospirillales bacterium]
MLAACRTARPSRRVSPRADERSAGRRLRLSLRGPSGRHGRRHATRVQGRAAQGRSPRGTRPAPLPRPRGPRPLLVRRPAQGRLSRAGGAGTAHLPDRGNRREPQVRQGPHPVADRPENGLPRHLPALADLPELHHQRLLDQHAGPHRRGRGRSLSRHEAGLCPGEGPHRGHRFLPRRLQPWRGPAHRFVNGYRYVVPEPVRNRVSDFFSNLTEIITFANAVLQGRPKTARRAAIRFAVNTMFTLGFYDLAGFRGIEQQREDFGQTLGVWGVGEGPYLVLPILGPSNLRDAAGLAVDAAPSVFLVPGDVASHPAYKASAYGLRPVDRRQRIAFRYYESGTPFEYDVIRILHREKRRLDILK